MIAPPATVHNQQLWQKQRRKVRALALRIIEGKIGVIEGSFQMGPYKTSLHDKDDEMFQIFRTVYLKTTHLPIGKARDHWSPEVLKDKDKEINEIECFYREAVIRAAVRIREKYL